MGYKIDNTNAISNVGIFNSSLPYDYNIADTLDYIWFPESIQLRTFKIKDRVVVCNTDSMAIGYLYSNDYTIVTQANSSNSGFTIDMGDGMIVLGDPNNDSLNVNAGLAFVYDYNGNLKHTLAPTTNVVSNIYFGASVSIKNNLISVSSSESNTGHINPGTIYVYYANGSLKSKTYRPIEPSVTSTDSKGFRGMLIDGYRILAWDPSARSSNGITNNVGAIYLFATDNSHIFTANQQVDIGQDDYFGLDISYSAGIISVGSTGYESQVGSYPLNDGLVSGISLYGDLMYRYDQGTSSPGNLGSYISAGGGHIAIAGYYTSRIALLSDRGEFKQWLNLPASGSPYFYTTGQGLQIHKNKLYVSSNNTIYYYDLPQTHSSYYNNIINNKAAYY